MGLVGYLYGEWAFANLLFGTVFLVAALGVAGIGYFVVRSDRLNRVGEDIEAADAADHDSAASEHH
jgi:hypothetical protein